MATVTLIEDGVPDRLIAVWPERVWRFMLDDGRTVDVSAFRDDSDLRGALVARMNASIVGVADVTPVTAAPEPPAAKRQPKRGGSR